MMWTQAKDIQIAAGEEEIAVHALPAVTKGVDKKKTAAKKGMDTGLTLSDADSSSDIDTPMVSEISGRRENSIFIL